MTTVYQNSRYKVDLAESAVTTDENYFIIHLEHGTVEGKSDNLPQALILAEQFAYILDNEQHKQMVKDMYAPAFSWPTGHDSLN